MTRPRTPPTVRTRWQDSYARGQRAEVLWMGEWLPAHVIRKTASGFPVLLTHTINPLSIVIDRKGDIRHA